MNITLFHWGVHAWIVYVIVALLLALVSHRHGRPMTIRSCFYPLIGNHVYSLIGDLIDTLSVVATMFGVCTSLGLGVITLSSGLHRLSSSIDESNNTTHVVIIWVITAIATVSVVSGLKIGIRRLSETCFALGMFLMLFVFFHGNTWYYLNVYVQSIGYYFQHVIETSFHTEAFAQEGNAPDGKENSKWMESWTIFYWGWWISWSPYVGMFIAKISRGRTIRNFLMYTMTAPVFYSFLWFSIFGAAGLTMEREAEIAGVNCSWLHGGKESEESYQGMYRLSCRASSQMFFDLMQSFNDRLTPFLYVISIIGIALYFVTSSDSGSLVIDCLSANGSPDPPVLQRVFWALTEGACATGLLVAGGSDALTALQTVSIAAGLPYTVVICFMCVSLWKALKHDDKRSHKNEVEFNSGLFRLFTSPFNVSKLVDLFIALTFPWLPAGRAALKARDKYMHMPMTVMAIMFYTVLTLLILQIVEKDIVYIACVVLMGYFAYVATQRVEIRQVCHIDGNVLEDFLVVMFLHPFAVDQMNKQMVLKRTLNGENEEVRLDEFKRNLEEIQGNETVFEHASNG